MPKTVGSGGRRVHRHGAALSQAEVAHLCVRASPCEALTHVPVRTPAGWELRHEGTLSAGEWAAHRATVRALTAALSPFTSGGLRA